MLGLLLCLLGVLYSNFSSSQLVDFYARFVLLLMLGLLYAWFI